MKKRKFLIVFLIIGIIYSLIIIIINRSDNSKKDKRNILIIGENVFEYKNNEISKTEEINKDVLYNVYINNNYYEKTNLNNKKIDDYEGLLLAYSDNLNIIVKNADIDIIGNNDLQRINNIMGYNVNMNDLFVNESITLDLDNNGINDKIVNVSNLDFEKDQSIYFNLTYVILNNDIEQVLIKEIVPAREVLISPVYYFYSTFNINNDSHNNIILQKRHFSMSEKPESLIYKYENGKYVLNEK